MDIFVLSKNEFNALMIRNGITDKNVESDTNSFFISINNTFSEELPYFTNHENVKVMYFDDTDDGKDILNGVPFSEEQAKDLFKFIKKNKNRSNCIIHCAAGISRSGAVGSFINDYIGGDWFQFKKRNLRIQPNVRIMSMLRKVSNI